MVSLETKPMPGSKRRAFCESLTEFELRRGPLGSLKSSFEGLILEAPLEVEN